MVDRYNNLQQLKKQLNIEINGLENYQIGGGYHI